MMQNAETLLLTHLSLAHAAASCYLGLDSQDALSAALQGLWEAASTFRADRDCSFVTYANRLINWRLGDMLRARKGRKGPQREALLELCHAKSLDEEISEDGCGNLNLQEVLFDSDALDPLGCLAWEDFRGWALAVLSRRASLAEKYVVSSRYELDGLPWQTQKQLGGQLGCTESRVNQLEKSGLQHLRKALALEMFQKSQRKAVP